jgi:hypothetical protein
MNCIGPGGAGARTHVHLAVGFLGHDAEQQRFGQARALELRPHHVAHVRVILVAADQRRAHVGEPAADAGLHRRVVLHHLVEAMVVAQQLRGARRFRHVGGDGRGRVVVARPSASSSATLGFGVGLRFSSACRWRAWSAPSNPLLHAAAIDVLHVLQRGIALGCRPGRRCRSSPALAVALLGGAACALRALRRRLVARDSGGGGGSDAAARAEARGNEARERGKADSDMRRRRDGMARQGTVRAARASGTWANCGPSRNFRSSRRRTARIAEH